MALKQWDAVATASTPAAGADAVVTKRRGYAGRTAEQLAAERRQRLIEAALTLFADRGFSRTPIELLCSTAKVTTRHFYEHFDSREAVLIALYEQINLETRATVMKALEVRGKNTEELMFAAIDAFVESCTVDTRRTRILCVEVIGVSSDMFERRRNAVHQFAKIVSLFTQQLVDSGGLPPGDYWHTSIAMVGAIRELMVEWLMSEKRPQIETVHEQIRRLLRCLIAGAGVLNREAASLKT